MGAVRGLLALLAALVVASAAVAAADAAVFRYRVVSAQASATVTFASPKGGQSYASGRADVRLRKQFRSARPEGLLSGTSGRLRFAVAGTNTERVRVGQREDETSPYVEQACTNRRRSSAMGGLLFRPAVRSRVEVRWALPHAAPQLCPGPRRAARLVASKMRRFYPASHFAAAQVRLVLTGSARFKSGAYRGTYRWRAVVTLARA